MEIPKVRLEDGRVAIDCLKAASAVDKAKADNKIFILDSLTEAQELTFRTKNTTYNLRKSSTGFDILGGRHFPAWSPVTIAGSTFGGSMLMVGRLAIGMNVEMYAGNNPNPITSTPVESISLKDIPV